MPLCCRKENPTRRVLLLVLVLAGAILAPRLIASGAKDAAPAETEKAQPPPRERRIYYFQHRLLPNWTHHSDGAFLLDLLNQSDTRLMEAAEEVVDRKFASRIKWQLVEDLEAAAIGFEKPRDLTHCYWVVIARVGEGFRYITLEKSIDRGSCAIGEWTADGEHLNYGQVRNTKLEPFLDFVRHLLGDPDVPIAAATKPPQPEGKDPEQDETP